MVGECVRFLFTSCEESKTNEWAQRTSEFAILHNEWIKIVQANQPWGNLYILRKKKTYKRRRSVIIVQVPLVQKVNSGIHRINLYPLDNATGSPNTYLLDSDLSGGYHYPAFEQLEPGIMANELIISRSQHQSNEIVCHRIIPHTLVLWAISVNISLTATSAFCWTKTRNTNIN